MFCVTISDPYFSLIGRQANSLQGTPAHAYYFFQGIEIKLLDQDHIYAREYEKKDNRTIDERIHSFVKLAKRLGKALIVELIGGKSIFIGQKKHEIFYINSANQNYLFGNVIGNLDEQDDENVYIVSAINPVFPLPEIVIYDGLREDLADFEILNDTLDLREVVEKAEQAWPNARISVHISQVGYDLSLSLLVNNQTQLMSVTLKHTLEDHWYEKLNVLIDAIP